MDRRIEPQVPILVLAVAVGMMLFGFARLRNTPVDVFPEFAPPRVEIQTLSLGLSSTEVEALVTIPLEQALNGVAGLDVIRSKSVSQLSSIELIFEPRHRHPPGAPAGRRADGDGHAEPADLGGPTGDDPARCPRPAAS